MERVEFPQALSQGLAKAQQQGPRKSPDSLEHMSLDKSCAY